MLLEVALEVPLVIAKGLASGQLERAGGVVRDIASKHVVMWLREGGQIASNPDLAQGVLKTLLDASSGGLVSTATGAINAAVSAQRNHQILQQLRVIQGISAVAATAPVAGLVVQIATTMYLARRIGELQESILGQLEHDRRIRLESAIEYVEKIITQLEGERKADAVDAVSRDLITARNDLKTKFKNVLSAEILTAENTDLASNLLLQGMQIDTAHVRIFLDSNRLDLAKNLLDDCLLGYKSLTNDLIQDLLGSKRARYFNNEVDDNDLFRYVLIEEWLRDSQGIMTELVLDNRDKFWNRTVKRSLGSNKRDLRGYTFIGHLEALTYSEKLIENYDRLIGYQAEINAIERLGISISEWEEQISNRLAEKEIDLAERKDFVLLVDEEWLAEQSDSAVA